MNDPAVPFGSFEGLEPWSAEPELVPRVGVTTTNGQDDEMREEIRRLVVEELRELMRR